MCEHLGELRSAMRRFTAVFDASALSGGEASAVMADAAALEAMAATVKGLAALRVAETGAWREAGDRSAASHLARRTGSSVPQASECLETARRLGSLPMADAAARAGSLSPAQAAAVAGAASVDPSAEARLVAKAGGSSLAELREECLRTRAAALPDGEARRRSIHDQRFLRSWTDAEGAWNLRMRDNPEVGAAVLAALAPIRDRLFRAARAEGREEATESYAADALAELARGGEAVGRAGRPGTKVIARVDLEALLRGYVMGGEVCELAGFGPVAVSAIRDLLDTGNPFLAAVVTRGAQVVGVAHLGRRPTASQQTALEWLYPSCAVEGCGAVTWLENDHRADWAKTGFTMLDLLDRLCTHHHDLKSQEGWSLVDGRGKRAFVPPEDRRHPSRASAA